MIKRLLFSFLGMISFISYGQDIKAELGSEGKFLVISNGGFVKMLIRDNDPTAIPDAVPGEFNLYTDGGNFFIRDGAFEAYPVDTMGVDYEYNFMYVDGANGRIGFNIISGRTDDANNFTELPLTSSITLFGSIATRVRLMDGTDSYELKQDDHTLILDNSSNNPTTDIVLPAVATAKGREYRFKRNIDRTGKIFIKPQPGEKLNGDVNNVVDLNNENASLEVVCDGDSWWVITELSPNLNRTTLTASTTLASEEIIDVNFAMANSTINLTLPDAADYEGKTYAIKRNANGATFDNCLLNVTPAGANTIDQFTNSSSLQLTRNFEAVIIESNGTNWLVVSGYDGQRNFRTVSATYSVKATDDVILVEGDGSMEVILPNPSTVPVGKEYTIKNKFLGVANSFVLKSTLGVNVDNVGSHVIGDNSILTSVQVVSDGTSWWIINR